MGDERGARKARGAAAKGGARPGADAVAADEEVRLDDLVAVGGGEGGAHAAGGGVGAEAREAPAHGEAAVGLGAGAEDLVEVGPPDHHGGLAEPLAEVWAAGREGSARRCADEHILHRRSGRHDLVGERLVDRAEVPDPAGPDDDARGPRGAAQWACPLFIDSRVLEAVLLER